VIWMALEETCIQMAMFADIAKAAGVLTNQTFEKGAESLTHVALPGGGTLHFSNGHNDGDGPVYVCAWSPSANILVLPTTIS
ncbi:MAG TPA: hypothetical protein VN203_20465, partial [Candidatus Acidoferrum sp.]|nr:hypothetical protein [Candidatus Acidoferrum sp.]